MNRSLAELVAQAEAAVATLTDPEMKRIAFQKALDDLRPSKSPDVLDSSIKLVQVLSVVIGVVVTVLTFNAGRQAETEARRLELEKYAHQRAVESESRQAEAAKPFLELRQRLYLEAVQAAAVLANTTDHTEAELETALKRFRELYVAELSLVEGRGVEEKMIALAEVIDPDLTTLTKKRRAAYDLSHALRDSLIKSWNVDETVLDNPDP